MGNMIIIIILIVTICIAVMQSAKHFKGQGGCCGGGSYKPKKKRLNHITAKRTFKVEGMHCENCRNKVMETVNDIPGVSAAVNLRKGIVEVSYEAMVEDSVIIEKIERAGYTVLK